MSDLPSLEEIQERDDLDFFEFSEEERKKIALEHMKEGNAREIQLEEGESKEFLDGYFKVRKTEDGLEFIMYSDDTK